MGLDTQGLEIAQQFKVAFGLVVGFGKLFDLAAVIGYSIGFGFGCLGVDFCLARLGLRCICDRAAQRDLLFEILHLLLAGGICLDLFLAECLQRCELVLEQHQLRFLEHCNALEALGLRSSCCGLRIALLLLGTVGRCQGNHGRGFCILDGCGFLGERSHVGKVFACL
ncbi:hypothetical protein D3C72_1331970 [compost metagenome]